MRSFAKWFCHSMKQFRRPNKKKSRIFFLSSYSLTVGPVNEVGNQVVEAILFARLSHSVCFMVGMCSDATEKLSVCRWRWSNVQHRQHHAIIKIQIFVFFQHTCENKFISLIILLVSVFVFFFFKSGKSEKLFRVLAKSNVRANSKQKILMLREIAIAWGDAFISFRWMYL